jgi:hypothetical protein
MYGPTLCIALFLERKLNTSFRRVILGSFLALLSIASGGLTYWSIGFGKGLAEILRGMGVKAKNPAIAPDEWFLIALCGVSAVAAVALFARRGWANVRAVAALGALGSWALVMMLCPEDRLQGWLTWRLPPLGDIAILAVAMVGLLAIVWKKSSMPDKLSKAVL